VAAKIALGFTLPEIRNSITKVTTAFFEPALDYIVCKFPRWDLQKFEGAEHKIGSEMKSVGEVMSIGRSFAEAIQKATRMLEIGADGLDGSAFEFADLRKELIEPTPKRLFAIAKAFKQGMSIDEVAELTHVDRFFLYEIHRIVELDKHLAQNAHGDTIEGDFLRELKLAGFSDKQIANTTKTDEGSIRSLRHEYGIRPYLAQIDTLAAEYPAETNFLYFTYAASKSDIEKSERPSVLVLGSGCYRIGSSVEFDWCAVSCVQTARELGYETILLNCNPETVSTDYDTCDRLIFDECSLETVLELVDFEKPQGVFVSMGGQTPNNLAIKLHNAGVKLIGTSADSIDTAESRSRFSALLDELRIDQPRWGVASNEQDANSIAERVGGYPVLVRPSYVLSGAAMKVANDSNELFAFLKAAGRTNSEHPVVVSKFEEGAREVEFDAVAKNGDVKLYALCEHIEDAGVHSGDATLVIPPQRLPYDAMREIIDIGRKLAKRLKITGPFNLQTLVTNHDMKVIELNLRASRSFPLISKTLGVNYIREATKLMLSDTEYTSSQPALFDRDYVVVKTPQFSFGRIRGADPRSGVEMGSTGEVACFGRTTEEALLKASMASGFKRPQRGVFINIEKLDAKNTFVREAQMLAKLGLKLYAEGETFRSLEQAGLRCSVVETSDTLRSHLKDRSIDWVVSIPGAARVHVDPFGYAARRMAIDMATSLTTDLWVAKRLAKAMSVFTTDELAIEPWAHYL